MNTRGILFGAAVILLACSCSTVGPQAPSTAPRAADFEASIARIERTEPASPALVNARLAYAAFLLSRVPGPSCGDRITRAQEEIGSARVNPNAQIMFPDGSALAADLEYRQHLAQANCGSQADRRDELLAAVEAARRAAERYRKVFDYRSMIVMHFDAAVVLHRLDEKAAALAELETALRMDREYGFADDARQNYQQLLAWRNEPAGAAQIAALMRDFPERRAVLKFGWHPTDAEVTLEWRREFLQDGQIAHSRAGAAFERRIGNGQKGEWSVSYEHRVAGYTPGAWPSKWIFGKAQGAFLPPALPGVPFTVSAKGELKSTSGSAAFSARLIASADQLIRAGAPADRQARHAVKSAMKTAANNLSPEMLAAETIEDYQLETAMWIGATLDQGVWYETEAPLSLPGEPRLVIQQHVEFAFTRRVPCTAGAATQGCVEIVIHATPDASVLGDVLTDFTTSYGVSSMIYDTSIEARLVIDPDTLLPYALEEWISSYGSIGGGKGDSLLVVEHLVSTTKYAAH